MSSLLAIVAVMVVCGGSAAAAAVTANTTTTAVRAANRYGFYRAMSATSGRRDGAGGGAESGRRVFGGRAAARDAWPAACLLLDRYMATRCSGSVVADHWALTAAHCVTPSLAYVQYNTRRPATGGDTSPVLVLYRHPGYRVVQEDLGRGTDVTLLHHDIGLVRTRHAMRLKTSPAINAIHGMTAHSLQDVIGKNVQVLGFGRTESAVQGEQLVEARLRVVACERGTWLHCVCGTGGGGERAVGVCSGDSGGPVVFRGAQLALTSMGPVECCEEAGGVGPDETATSVFTALYEYAPLVNATILNTENAMRMTRIASDARALATPLTILNLIAIAVTFAAASNIAA